MEFGWSEEQEQLFEGALAFARELPESVLDEQSFRRAFARLGEFGALGLCIAEELGGMGLASLDAARAVEGLGQGCADLGLLFSAAAHLFACAVPIAAHASPALAERVVPKLCSGEWVGANAITEAEAGSDVGALRTRARREGDEYVLDGVKSYVTNGPFADVFMVYATIDPAHGYMGVTGFVVERDRPGLRVGEAFETMGLESSPIASLYLDGCRIPASNRVGEEGSGSTIFAESMHYERTGLLAAWVGGMQRVLARVVEHARERRQFRRPIGKFQAVSHAVADMMFRLESARLLLYRACWARDRGEQATAEVALAKLAISEGAVQNALAAIQIFGGAGYIKELGIERMLRDAVPTTIFSGTSEIQRDLIARDLGL
ncbi:acyl-CoA dehydrogenase family protein [Pseudenhygromyxa sp. WMMC2535]|uniref:acyl-CoA dehydrogenase family protein n=1 Tax=Pseudenhygromyxa sp. WMMC2535 TaxID=2712867 RepID=UPI001552EFAA|nr:acyl-CoA dehydrogenase family protein [Pseudenhygromyxa sp. WMMC2535]NVB37541.1 acyl-CoA dehydrogenase family protein [Pseudenhygromyxa sp. WMMC2535]